LQARRIRSLAAAAKENHVTIRIDNRRHWI
jgi:hypothetical protein